MLDGTVLRLKDQVRSLGALLDLALLVDQQVTAVARSVFYHLWQVYQLRPFLGKKDLFTITHALETTRLDYCNALYVGLPLESAWTFQLIQNVVVWLLMGASRFQNIAYVPQDFVLASDTFPMPNSRC